VTLTVVNARQASCLYQIRTTLQSARHVAQQRDRSGSLIRQEAVMSKYIHAGATAVAIFSSVGFAAAQNASNHADLTPTQQRTLSQGLANSPSQSAPATQPQVGDKMPDSITAQSIPSNVTDQVPEAKNLLFVKLPDRVLLIDPDNKVVTELVMDSGASGDTTTGSNSGSSYTGSSDRPSR
jgi:hypothetical protein